MSLLRFIQCGSITWTIYDFIRTEVQGPLFSEPSKFLTAYNADDLRLPRYEACALNLLRAGYSTFLCLS